MFLISENEIVEKLVTDALKKCANEIKKIATDNPDSGIGDTSTDEAIIEMLYGMIH